MPFRYDQLDAGKVIEMPTSRRSTLQKPKNEWLMKTLLVTQGERRTCQFALRLNADNGKPVLSIHVM